MHAALVGPEFMVFAWPEPPSAIPAEKSAGVRGGMEAFAFCGIETPPSSWSADKRTEKSPGMETGASWRDIGWVWETERLYSLLCQFDFSLLTLRAGPL